MHPSHPANSIPITRNWAVTGLVILAITAGPLGAIAQEHTGTDQGVATYRFRLAVDEVSLSFHAADAHGLPVNDLKLDELKLLDNGRPPRRVLSFHLTQDSPLRAAILLDTSASMDNNLDGNKAIALLYAQRLLKQTSDQAFVMDFGYISKILQSWTTDPRALVAGIRQVVAGRENPLGGTAMFDATFRACFNEFGKVDHAASGNFVLLFTDGEDNASHTALQEVVDICQHSNTSIYSFRSESNPRHYSPGREILAELAAQTGGRVFAEDDTEAAIDKDLGVIEADLRNQYRLVYNPAVIKHDGSFHHIQLHGPERVDSINARSGYYAPVQ